MSVTFTRYLDSLAALNDTVAFPDVGFGYAPNSVLETVTSSAAVRQNRLTATVFAPG